MVARVRIVINAGHTKFGLGTGAVGHLNESRETRKIAYSLMAMLAETEHEVIPAVFDRSGKNLVEAVAKAENADLFLSIHLNAGGGKGSEVYNWKGQADSVATSILKNLHRLGFANRGTKDGSRLYVIKNTACKALLVEVCFVDQKEDASLYEKVGYENVAKAIFDAIK